MKEYREEQIYFEFLILNINHRFSLYAKPKLQDLRGSKVVPAVMAGCRADTGRGRQDLCTPLTDSGGEVSPLRFQNSFNFFSPAVCLFVPKSGFFCSEINLTPPSLIHPLSAPDRLSSSFCLFHINRNVSANRFKIQKFGPLYPANSSWKRVSHFKPNISKFHFHTQ